MKHSKLGVALAGLLACGLLAPAIAQDPDGGQGRGGRRGFGGFQRGERGQRGPGGGPGGFGGQRGPGGGMFGQGGPGMRFGGQDKNPLVTHVFELINRPDVQNEIGMDLRQKNALAQYQSQMQDSIRQQMQQMFQNMRGQEGGRGRRGQGGEAGAQGGQAGQPGQPQDRDQQREQFRQQFEQQRNQIQGNLEKGLKDLLKPEQVRRLYQLDLQWRGVLSIADPAVAQEVGASQQTRTAVAGFLTEYQNKSREARQELMQSLREQRRSAANNSNPNQGAGIRQDPFIAIERADAASRKEAEEKAVKALTAQERANWTQIQGKQFTFRSDIRSPQRAPF